MTTYDIVKDKLERHPIFRERKNRGEYLAILAMREIGIEYKHKENIPLTLKELSDFAVKYDTYRHAWGDVTRENESLRGEDYKDGENLAQKKQLEMGYIPGFEESIKALNKL